MGEKRNSYRILVGKPEEREQFQDLGVDGKAILKWVLKKWERSVDLVWLITRTRSGLAVGFRKVQEISCLAEKLVICKNDSVSGSYLVG
jgi:hypothetical protein